MASFPPQGGGSGGGGPQGGVIPLVPGIIKPVHIAVNTKNKWLFDPFFYTNLASLLEHGYLTDGTAAVFTNGSGTLTVSTAGTTAGVLASTLTHQSFNIPNPLEKDDIVFRALVKSVDIGVVDTFTFIGLFETSVNGELTTTAALDTMGDSIGFLVGDDDLDVTNWVCITQVGTTRTTTDTGIDADNATEKKLEFRSVSNGVIEFLIDGVVVASHSTNIPVGASLPFRVGALNAGGGPASIAINNGLSIASSEPI